MGNGSVPSGNDDSRSTGKGSLVSRAVGRLDRIGAHFGAAGIVLIMLATTADVLRRSMQGRSVPGVIEGAEVVLVIAVFLGLGLAQRDDIHVSTSLVVDRVPRRLSRIMRAFGLAVLAIFLVWAVWASGRSAYSSYFANEFRFGMIRIPLWPGRAAICIGWSLILMEVLLDLHGVLTEDISKPPARDVRTGEPGAP